MSFVTTFRSRVPSTSRPNDCPISGRLRRAVDTTAVRDSGIFQPIQDKPGR